MQKLFSNPVCSGSVAHSAGATTVAALNIEPQCNIYCLLSLSLRFWRVQYMGAMN
jgi:hypothetical protein